jgi:hypothetical protein
MRLTQRLDAAVLMASEIHALPVFLTVLGLLIGAPAGIAQVDSQATPSSSPSTTLLRAYVRMDGTRVQVYSDGRVIETIPPSPLPTAKVDNNPTLDAMENRAWRLVFAGQPEQVLPFMKDRMLDAIVRATLKIADGQPHKGEGFFTSYAWVPQAA